MNSNQLMTAGAIGFAGFALWYITRKPGGAVTTQPAQQAQGAALVQWNDLLSTQSDEILGLNMIGTGTPNYFQANPYTDIFKG